MSRHRTIATCLVATLGLAISSVPASAQLVVIDAPPVAAVPDYLGAVREITSRRTRADCVAEAMSSSDIVVCAPIDDQQLPVPEVYGPKAGSTDGAAIDPRGPPCGASISNDCYGSINLLVAIPAAIGVVQLLIDPDRNLGEGTPIPERFRGANR